MEIITHDKKRVEQNADNRNKEINKHLLNELQKLDEGIQRHNTKQKAENSRFQAQIGQCKEIRADLERDIGVLKNRVTSVEVHLGVNDIVLSSP